MADNSSHPGTLHAEINELRAQVKTLQNNLAAAKTELEQTRADLERSLAEFTNAQSIAPFGNYTWHIPTNTLNWSESLKVILGCSDREPSYDLLVSLIHPDDRATVLAYHTQARATGIGFDLEYRIVRPDGEVRYLHDRAQVQYGTNGQAITMFGIIDDITPAKLAQLELEASREKWRMLAATVPDIIMMLDRTGTLLSVSRSITGTNPEDVIGRNFFDFVREDYQALVREHIERVFQTGEITSYEVKGPRGMEPPRWFITRVGPVIYGGEVTAATVIATDITERKLVEAKIQEYQDHLEEMVEQRTTELTATNAQLQHEIAERRRTEKTLRDNEQRYRRLVEGLHGNYCLYSHTPAGIFLYVSPGFKKLFGIEPEAAIGQNWRDVIQFVPESFMLAEESDRNMRQGHASPYLEYEYLHPDGTSRFIETSAGPVYDDTGRTIAIEGIVKDITAQKRVEIELRALNQMKDDFVSNISHELRTPITNLLLREHILARRPEEIASHLPVLNRETERLMNTIEDLLRLSRLDQGRTEIQFEYTDLNQIVTTIISDRTPIAEQNQQQICFTPTAPLQSIRTDSGLVAQILSILLTNALNYTPGGGVITVRTTNRHANQQVWVGFSVHNTGSGIPPEEQSRLFERFYRGTVGVQSGRQGTGLGLAIAQEITLRLKGQIEVFSPNVPGQGATFSVWLPNISTEDQVSGKNTPDR